MEDQLSSFCRCRGSFFPTTVCFSHLQPSFRRRLAAPVQSRAIDWSLAGWRWMTVAQESVLSLFCFCFSVLHHHSRRPPVLALLSYKSILILSASPYFFPPPLFKPLKSVCLYQTVRLPQERSAITELSQPTSAEGRR